MIRGWNAYLAKKPPMSGRLTESKGVSGLPQALIVDVFGLPGAPARAVHGAAPCPRCRARCRRSLAERGRTVTIWRRSSRRISKTQKPVKSSAFPTPGSDTSEHALRTASASPPRAKNGWQPRASAYRGAPGDAIVGHAGCVCIRASAASLGRVLDKKSCQDVTGQKRG
jgi:hypothetical protein